MALYPKRLRSIDDLERERKALRRKKAEMEEDDILSTSGIIESLVPAGAGGIISSLAGYLPGAGPLLEIAMKFVKNKFGGSSDETVASPAFGGDRKPRSQKTARSMLYTVAREFIGGYLKWKAIELSVKGAKHLIKKNQEKKRKSSKA